MNEPPPKIAVTLIDDASGETLASVALTRDNLPESFAAETTLHLAGADWRVVHAEPGTREGYAATGALTLRMRRIEAVDPHDVLFSLPSICDRIPPVGTEPRAGDEGELSEDDWRQFEFVSRVYAAESEAEIEVVRRIHEQDAVEAGWRRIHVRRRPDPPIAAALTRADLDRAFAGATFRGLAYRELDSPIVGGFSFRTGDGLECYGLEEDGRVTVLGVLSGSLSEHPVRSVDILAGVARAHELDLVHWCRCGKAEPGAPLFQELIRAWTGPDNTPRP